MTGVVVNVALNHETKRPTGNEYMQVKMSASDKDKINHAAHMMRLDMATFVRSIAVEAATQIIAGNAQET